MPASIPGINNHYCNFYILNSGTILNIFIEVISFLIDGMPIIHLWNQKERNSTEK